MRVSTTTLPFAVLLASLLTPQMAHAECVQIVGNGRLLQLQQFATDPRISAIFRGTVVSSALLGTPERTAGLIVTFDVGRIWKGSVGTRVELVVDWNAENPRFSVGNSSPVFARTLDAEGRRRLGLTGTDAPALAAVPCTDDYLESEITAILGPGDEPRKPGGHQ